MKWCAFSLVSNPIAACTGLRPASDGFYVASKKHKPILSVESTPDPHHPSSPLENRRVDETRNWLAPVGTAGAGRGAVSFITELGRQSGPFRSHLSVYRGRRLFSLSTCWTDAVWFTLGDACAKNLVCSTPSRVSTKKKHLVELTTLCRIITLAWE